MRNEQLVPSEMWLKQKGDSSTQSDFISLFWQTTPNVDGQWLNCSTTHHTSPLLTSIPKFCLVYFHNLPYIIQFIRPIPNERKSKTIVGSYNHSEMEYNFYRQRTRLNGPVIHKALANTQVNKPGIAYGKLSIICPSTPDDYLGNLDISSQT